jgi:excisionase family DNA binding protein
MLTVREAAEHVRLTQWAIYRAIQRGDLAAFKPGGRLRIQEADLDARVDTRSSQVARRGPIATDRPGCRHGRHGAGATHE